MLEFERLNVDNLRIIKKYLCGETFFSDLSLGYLLMWKDELDIRFAVYNDTLVLREKIGEQFAFSYPSGENVDAAVEELLDHARKNDIPLRFYPIDERTLKTLKEDKRFDSVSCAFDRRWSDYVYSFADASTFRGKKFGGQRNHVNKFRSLYGAARMRFYDMKDREAVLKMLSEYESEHKDAAALEKTELQKTAELLDNAEALGLYAAVLPVGGEIVALSIGEVVKDTLVIHTEKALRKYEGIYPTVYSCFVNLVSERLGGKIKYVNREDDSGDEGLRTSKLQYHPIFMADKYLVHINSPAASVGETFSVNNGDVVLTEIRESDKSAYRSINEDIESNKWWGYDYREDDDLTFPITDDTFYDSVKFDNAVGDSVNFAVRLADDGEMIGECIIWNFTFSRKAEIGCRIVPRYRKKGYGRKAFAAALRFAREKLSVKPTARCFVENDASAKMITACGLKMIKEENGCRFFAE